MRAAGSSNAAESFGAGGGAGGGPGAAPLDYPPQYAPYPPQPNHAQGTSTHTPHPLGPTKLVQPELVFDPKWMMITLI